MSNFMSETVEAFLLVMLYLFVLFKYISPWLEKLHSKNDGL